MKKSLKIFSLAALLGATALSTVGCWNPFAGDGKEENNPQPPIIKDINYYQVLIAETENYLSECDAWLAEIAANKDDYDSEKDYQSAFDEVQAEKFLFQAQINEYQACILFLEAEDLEFTPGQILQGITIFTAAISNLENELKLKAKYPDYYTELELQEIKDGISLAEKFLEFFLRLKED